jgi:O-methyltransferase
VVRLSHDAGAAFPAPPSEADAAELFRRAQQLAREGGWAEALATSEAVLGIAPEWPGAFELIGDALVGLEMWERAARSYVTALGREPENPGLFLKLGDLQKRCADDVGAAQSYRRASDLNRSGARAQGSARSPLEGSPGAAAAYLELMKDCLTFLLWGASDGSVIELNARQPIVSLARVVQRIARWRKPEPSLRETGMDWPARALTMVGKRRLDNVQCCVEQALAEQVPGDLLEAGVWRGGTTIFMRAILRAYGDTQRKVWVADSFRGLPRPNVQRYPADRGYALSSWRSLAVSLEEVRANFHRFQLLDEQVAFLEGWFRETLPAAPLQRLAVLRLDGDLYESTHDTLAPLYSKVSSGGFVIVDDYYSAAPCRQAVDDFRARNEIRERIVRVDGCGAFWRKE